MSQWEQNVRAVEPYVPGEQPDFENMIKLNTNECPYPPSIKAEEALKEMQYSRLRLYPDFHCSLLVKELANYYHVSENQVFVGVGSDDVLATAFLTFFNSKKPILFPDITYSFYDVWANLYQIPYECQPLDDNFRIKKEDYLKENGGIVLANPNAPTSIFESVELLEEIVKANQDVVVIIDEAYVDFGGESALRLVNQYDNVLIVQTFSKSRSMAGLRIGFCIGNEKLIEAISNVKFSINSYTMNEAALVVGKEAVIDDVYFHAIIDKVVATRERVKKELKELGFSFPDSKTNFLFATHKSAKAVDIFEYLKTKKIFVRYFNKPRINNYLRITIGTDEQMDVFLTAIKEFLSN